MVEKSWKHSNHNHNHNEADLISKCYHRQKFMTTLKWKWCCVWVLRLIAKSKLHRTIPPTFENVKNPYLKIYSQCIRNANDYLILTLWSIWMSNAVINLLVPASLPTNLQTKSWNAPRNSIIVKILEKWSLVQVANER